MLLLGLGLHAQTLQDFETPTTPAVESLQLPQSDTAALECALSTRDYLAAERILLATLDREPHSNAVAQRLAFAGTVYFLNHDDLNAAIAWKKAEALGSLDVHLRFSLAMSYVRLRHADWARAEIQKLAAEDPHNALYPFWLGRLDYDGHKYNDAIGHFQQAIALDPTMARAYDNLGLCYYYGNQNDSAVDSFHKAIDLDSSQHHPSPWPYLNLAVVEQFLNHSAAAEASLKQALDLAPAMAQAHFRLGTVYEDQARYDEAAHELIRAAELDLNYAEPHMALARIYHHQGKQTEARHEVEVYRRLHSANDEPPPQR